MTQCIAYHHDQTLSYGDYGNPDGYPILVQHGLIASIKDAALFQRLLGQGTRVICIARPGYGASSPYEMKDVAEWGSIVAALVDALQLSQFDVFGISSGAPYSYAIGYRLPEKTRHIYILSGTPALFDERVLAHWPYPISKDAKIPEMQQLAKDLFFSDLSEADLRSDDVRDSMMNDCFGIAQDFRIRCRDWGFDLSEVKPPVWMRHSRADSSVPLATAEITARLLANCRLEIRENDPHFSNAVVDDFIQTTILERLACRDQTLDRRVYE
ncbi:MAG TPA: alpha/beta hydrolase [Anaerolineaceae bacterium]|nr:alpha/beta hydrolase [Anaerolineaceae bacterium]